MSEPADDDERLRRVLGQEGLARLTSRLRDHFERGSNVDTLVLNDVNASEHRAIAGLLGKPLARGRSLRIRLADIDVALRRAELAPSLRSAIASLHGPLRDLPGERLAQQQAWRAVFDTARADPRARALGAWLEALQRTGLLKRLSNGDPAQAGRLLAGALCVLEHLPGRGMPLSTLAANALGDAHALDPGQPVATLVTRALQHSVPGAEPQQSNEAVRELWGSAGVVVGGAITSTALVLNLPARGDGRCAGILRTAGAQGEPLWLTLRQLATSPPQWPDRDQDVYICENPAVVAEAADRLGAGSAPLICTCGQPSAAIGLLLSSLRAAGATLHYHGDFDWPGIAIANGLIHRYDVLPWRFGDSDYRAAAAGASLPLKGRPVRAVWDATLSESMQQTGLAVPEESTIIELLQELSAAP